MMILLSCEQYITQVPMKVQLPMTLAFIRSQPATRYSIINTYESYLHLSDVRYKTKKGEKAVLLPSPLYLEDRRNETRIAIHSRFILSVIVGFMTSP